MRNSGFFARDDKHKSTTIKYNNENRREGLIDHIYDLEKVF